MKILLRYVFSCYSGVFCLLFFTISLPLGAQQTGALTSNIVTENAQTNLDFPVVAKDHVVAPLRYDKDDYKGVIRAIGDLQNDIDSVTGVKPQLFTSEAFAGYEIVIGTLGKSKLIDKLVSSKKLDVKDLKREILPIRPLDSGVVLSQKDMDITRYQLINLNIFS